MYIPSINLMEDNTEIVTFMKRFSFATIITSKDNVPQATHLPFVVNKKNGTIRLISHFNKLNEQWRDIENSKVLVVFSEPHAYISPKNYEKELNVPTWNYISVHVYGEGRIISDPDKVTEILEKTIDNYEASYRQQWDNLPEKYKEGMAKGIVAFEINVTEVKAKEKLSQDKKLNEQQNIVNSLARSKDSNEQITAEFMNEKLSKNKNGT
jgi:transcriptional regulator